jgi:hypothetical protein
VEKKQTCNWLSASQIGNGDKSLEKYANGVQGEVMNHIQWPSLPSQGVGGREKDV